MNLPFLKLELAGSPWLLFDLTGPAAFRPEPDWPAVAAGVCSRIRGASGDGVIVAESDGDGVAVSTWDGGGRPCRPPPAAVLCASRWLFDRGLAGPDSIPVRSGYGVDEALVIDSRNFGLPFGEPELAGDGAAAARLGAPAAGPRGAMVVAVGLGGSEFKVTLRDGPPRRQAARASAEPGVEAMVTARHELRLKAGRHDPVAAAAAAVAAAAIVGFCDREAAAMVRGERLAVQWPEGEALFVAGAPMYCLSGEFWAGDQ